MKARVFAFVVGSLLLAAVSLWVGPPLSPDTQDFVLLQLRLPRVLVGALVGATLSISGAAFQAVFNNALATPSTIGTTAGATLGALIALALDVGGGFFGVSLLTAASFGGAMLSTLLVSGLAASGRLSKNDVLLAGIAVTLAVSALASGVQFASDARALVAAAQWSLGQLPQVGYRGVALIAPFATVTLVGLLALGRPLQNLAMGEDLAQTQGVNVARLRFGVLLVASLGVAACVAWCGPIAFVGLIVPHLVRLLIGPSLRALLPLSFLGGAAFLVVCDALARVALPGRELPVGVITAALGAPALVFLVSRGRRE
ncbi:MAG: iron ABC transporter permease [Myxococcales bacterium]|nr:MAG: iron ABC transporter permease [Myxococcales bacterium]